MQKTETHIYLVEMSKTSPKTKGRREKEGGGTRQREKVHKKQARRKTERKKPYERAL